MQQQKLPKGVSLFLFSYLSGHDLITKVALLSTSWRRSLPKAGLLDQTKQIKVRMDLVK